MKNLFIDTNVWLSLYHFTNDDLAQFSKLKDLIGSEIRLFVPQQVSDEISRNREAKLKDAFKMFELKSIQFPAFCKAYEEYESFSKDYASILSRYKQWKKKIDADILSESLPADIIITDFLELTETIPTEEYVDAAYMRYRIGNPPGKDNKYGDAVNWECLLHVVPDGEDLYIISTDKDYRSELSDNEFNPFLKKEWEQKKGSKIVFYRNLVPFLNEHIKDVQLKTEQEKQELIKKLSDSCNFETTHGLITMLGKHTGWTESQIEEMCSIAEENTQVAWILGDPDVQSFYSRLLSKINYEELPDCATKRTMEKLFGDAIAAEAEANARSDFEADRDEAYEEYYKH